MHRTSLAVLIGALAGPMGVFGSLADPRMERIAMPRNMPSGFAVTGTRRHANRACSAATAKRAARKRRNLRARASKRR